MAAIVLGQRLAPTMSVFSATLAPLRNSTLFDVIACLTVGVVLEFIPAVGLAAFTRSMDNWPVSYSSACSTSLYVAVVTSIVGSAAALPLVYWLLMPGFGTISTTAVAIVELSLLLISTAFIDKRHPNLSMLLVSAAGALMFCLGTGIGEHYTYGRAQFLAKEPKVEFFRVGRTGDVRVCNDEFGRWIEYDGISLAGTPSAPEAEFGIACFPQLLRPEARRVLVIGYGDGIVSGASMLFPQVEVTCAEPEPGIVSAEALFDDVNYRPGKSNRFTLMQKDGLSMLRAVGPRYDLILIPYANPALPEQVMLLTKQTYASAKRLLSPDGIVAQRLLVAAFSTEGVATVARTFSAAFIHCALIRISNTDSILLGSDSPLIESKNSVKLAQKRVDRVSVLTKEITRRFGTTDVTSLLMRYLLLDEHGLRKLGRTDSEVSLLTDSSWSLRSSLHIGFVSANNLNTPDQLILGAASLDSFQKSFELCGGCKTNASVCHDVALEFYANGYDRIATDLVSWGLQLDSHEADLVADNLIWSLDEDPKTIEGVIDQIEAQSTTAINRIGVSLWRRGLYLEATRVFERLTKLTPYSATAWANLAVNWKALNNLTKAEECFGRALSLDAQNEFLNAEIKRGKTSAFRP